MVFFFLKLIVQVFKYFYLLPGKMPTGKKYNSLLVLNFFFTKQIMSSKILLELRISLKEVVLQDLARILQDL